MITTRRDTSMLVNVYQNPGHNRDEYSKDKKYNIARYKKAWGGEVNGTPTLEGVYRAIALNKPAGKDGVPFSGEIGPTDIIEVVDAPNVPAGFYFINERGFSRLTEEQIEDKASFSITRDGKEIYLTDEELKAASAFYRASVAETEMTAKAAKGYDAQMQAHSFLSKENIFDRGA